MDSSSSSSQSHQTREEKEKLKEGFHEVSVPQFETFTPSKLKFDRLQQQPQDQVLFIQEKKRFEFGQFVARQALLDEEYWVSQSVSIQNFLTSASEFRLI